MKLLLVLTTLLISACGQVKKPQSQSDEQLILPKAGKGFADNFGLNESGTVTIYSGSLLLWDDQVSIEQIKAISESTRDGRRLKLETLQYLEEAVEPLSEKLKTQESAYQTLTEEMETAKRQARANGLAMIHAQKAVSADFFVSRLEELEASEQISADDKSHAEEMFPRYCEYKLWELAFNAQLQHAFALRPTPLEMCEYYYKDRYFTDEALCGPAADIKEGKNYFRCLWEDGLMKSPLYTAGLQNKQCRGDHGKSLVSKWYRNGLMQRLIFDTDTKSRATYSRLFADSVLAGKPINALVRLKKVEGVKVYSELSACSNAFRRASQEDVDADVASWAFEKPTVLQEIGEVKALDVAQKKYKLLPSSGDEAQDQANWTKLTQYIDLFAKRSGFGGIYPISVGDEYNNLPVKESLTADADQKEKVFTSPVFAKLLDLESKLVPAAMVARHQALGEQIEKDRLALEKARQEGMDPFQERMLANTLASADLVGEAGATVYLRSFQLQLFYYGDALIMRYSGDDQHLVGCLKLDDNAPCLMETKSSETLVDKLWFEEDSGKLIFEVKLSDPKPLQLSYRPRDLAASPYFNEVPFSQVAGQTFRLELAPSRLAGLLDWVSGAATINNGAKTSYYGSTTMDNFDQAANR